MSKPMTHEQMAAILEDVLENEDLWRDSRNDLRRVMHDLRAEPPCACGGREPIAVAQSKVSGGWVLASVELDVKLGVDRDVDVLVFADEGAKE